jgi:NADH-quinone oxidoreductase subunit G
LGNLFNLEGFDFEASTDVLQKAQLGADRLSNATAALVRYSETHEPVPVVASIYQLDGLVRRAPSLQMTADGRAAHEQQGAAA